MAGCATTPALYQEKHGLGSLTVVFLDEGSLHDKWKSVTGKEATSLISQSETGYFVARTVVEGYFDFRTHTIYCSKEVLSDAFAGETRGRARIVGYPRETYGLRTAVLRRVTGRMVMQSHAVDPEPGVALSAADKAKRRTALAALKNRGSSKQERMAALQLIRQQAVFSPFAGRTLMDFLERTRDPELRERAADAYYLLFYEMGRSPEVVPYLTDPDQLLRFERLLSLEEPTQAKVFLLQSAQVMIGSYGDWSYPAKLADDLSARQRRHAETLAAAYVPILIRALFVHLADPDDTVRNEILVALDNMAITDFAQSAEAVDNIERWYALEPDESLKEWLPEHEIFGPLVAQTRQAR